VSAHNFWFVAFKTVLQMWDGSLDSTHDIIIGNMQELCLRVWLVSTYESVRWGIIIEKCKNPCNTCFNWAARDWDSMVAMIWLHWPFF